MVDMKKQKNLVKILVLANIIIFVVFLTVLIGFNNLDQFLLEPLLTPQQYLDSHPYISIGNFIWSEPSSTVLVYLLGILTIGIGFTLLKKGKAVPNNLQDENDPSLRKRNFQKIWGISLIIWGLGTMLAGTSYQAFYYELKCRNQPYCLWTTWWEIGYLILTVISVNTMVVAQSWLRSNPKSSIAMNIYASINLLIYQLILIFGMLLINEFMLSFEMMVVFQLSSFILMMISNIIVYRNSKEKIEFKLIKIWILLAIVMIVYFGYLFSGIPEILWESGIWFNANDILHVGLIGWMIYIYITLKKFAHKTAI
ncbi:DUF6962 family protein [Candidatus Lokiarchaeum ossiferum]